MIDKFLFLKNSIKKALIDLEMGELWIEENIITLNNILKVLKPIKLAIERLSSRDSNILISDAIVNTLCEEIQSMSSDLSKKMFQALYLRIDERRDKKLYTLIKFLKQPDFFDSNHTNSLFSYASKCSVITYAENIFYRLFGFCNNVGETKSNDDVEKCVSKAKKTFEEALNAAIKNVNSCSQSNSKTTSKHCIRKEFKYFEGSGQKTQNIEYLFNAILTIRPTSVESERMFSVTGQFVNKIRNRLSDESINALSVLKNYFLNQNKKLT